jgi:hypothetical protein
MKLLANRSIGRCESGIGTGPYTRYTSAANDEKTRRGQRHERNQQRVFDQILTILFSQETP